MEPRQAPEPEEAQQAHLLVAVEHDLRAEAERGDDDVDGVARVQEEALLEGDDERAELEEEEERREARERLEELRGARGQPRGDGRAVAVEEEQERRGREVRDDQQRHDELRLVQLRERAGALAPALRRRGLVRAVLLRRRGRRRVLRGVVLLLALVAAPYGLVLAEVELGGHDDVYGLPIIRWFWLKLGRGWRWSPGVGWLRFFVGD